MQLVNIAFIIGLVWESGSLPPAGRAYPSGFAGFFATDSSFDRLPITYGADAYSTLYNTNYWYDVSNNSWSTRASAPAPSRYDGAGTFAMFAGEKHLFVFGGYGGSGNYSNASARYRYSTNTWTSIANLPYSAEGIMAAGTIGGYIYVMGGENNGTVYNYNYRYDPVSNTYSSRTSIPQAKSEGACAIGVNENGDSCVYLFTGIYSMDVWGAYYTSNCYEYNPASNSWRSRASFPGVAVNGASAATLRNRIYVMGGFDGSYDYTQVYVYNPTTNTWSTGPSLPSARDGGIATAPDLPLEAVNLIYPNDGDTVCSDTIFIWHRGDGAVKITYAGAGTASGITLTCWNLTSVVQGYVLRYGTDPTLSAYTQVWNDASGSTVDDVDTTESLPGGSGGGLSPETWYYWTVGTVDDMNDTAWSDTFRFYHCDPTYQGVGETGGSGGYKLFALTQGHEPQLVLISPVAQRFEFTVYDPAGKMLMFREINAVPGKNRIDLHLKGAGVFLIQARSEKGVVLRTRLIKLR